MIDRSRKEIVNSLANGLKVLRLFGDRRGDFTITEVARDAGMTPASARRVLLTLSDLGYVAFERNRAHLTPKVLDLGYGYLSSQPFWHVAQPILERVSVELGHPSSAAALSLPDIVFLIRAPRQVGTLLVSVGTRFPAWAMALGRALLAELPAAELDSYLRSVDFKPFTPFTVVDANEIGQRVAEVHTQGYALVDREYDVGVRAIAVPVRNRSGTAVASIDVAVDPRLHGVELLVKTALPALISAANEIRNSLPG